MSGTIGNIRSQQEEIKRLRAELDEVYRGITVLTNELASAADALREGEEKLRGFLDSATESFALWDSGLNLVEINRVGLKLFPPGTTKEDVIGNNLLDLVSDLKNTGIYDNYLNVIRTGEPFILDNIVPHPIFGERHLAVKAFNVGDGLGMILTDITERKRAEEVLRLNAQVFESTQEGIIITDAQVNIITTNSAFTGITGYELGEVIGKNPRLLQSGRHDGDFYWYMWESLNGTGHWQGEIWNRRKDGTVFPEWLNISTVKNDAGEITNYIGVFNDITIRKETEEYFKHVATHDPLTDLPNRPLFFDRLEHAIFVSKRYGQMVAVMFLDLDGFKSVNDTFGHENGDRLLREIAIRLKNSARESDTVARLGGDEFTCLLEKISDRQEAENVAQRIITELSKPFDLSGIEVSISVSIGISIYPGEGDDADTMLRHADTAMYRVKQAGKNNYKFFANE